MAYAGHDQFMKQYHEALKKELELFAHNHPCVEPIKTIFFGGGTPSTYPDDLLLDMSATLKRLFNCTQLEEMSIEVNPGTVRVEQLPLWAELGINRLSIGVQSLNDSVLKNLNRHQSALDVTTLLDRAKDHIPNISVDLIIGLPGVSVQEWKSLVHTAVQWPIKHISIYFLTIHEGTALYFRVKKNDVVLPIDDEIVDLYVWTTEFLANHGFEQYEISNFAREGSYSRHNSVYWAHKPYKGFGVGACSFDGKFRYQNNKNLFKYLAGIEQDGHADDFCEELADDQLFLEKIMLGLRQTKGIRLEYLLEGVKQTKEHTLQVLKELEDVGYIKSQAGFLQLTPAGLAVENELIIRLAQ